MRHMLRSKFVSFGGLYVEHVKTRIGSTALASIAYAGQRLLVQRLQLVNA